MVILLRVGDKLKSIKITIPLLIIIFCITIILLRSRTGGDSEGENTQLLTKLATPSHPVDSPSGMFRLNIKESIEDNVKCWSFYITNTKGEVYYSSKNIFRIRDTLFFTWDQQDRVWVYSGDLGVYYWSKIVDKEWVRYTFKSGEDTEAPETLKKLRPRFFK